MSWLRLFGNPALRELPRESLNPRRTPKGRAYLALFLALWLLILPNQIYAYYALDPAAERSVDEDGVKSLQDSVRNGEKNHVRLKPPELHGPYRIELRVMDEASQKPVTEFLVHAAIRMTIPATPEQFSSRGIGNPFAPADAPDSSPTPTPMPKDPYTSQVGRIESRLVNDPDGSCEYADLAAGEYEFQVASEGYSTVASVVVLPEGGTSLTISMPRPRTFKGRLIAADTGTPFSGMRVRVSDHYSGMAVHPRSGGDYNCTTDDDGRFLVADLPPDSYWVRLLNNPDDIRHLYESDGDLKAEAKAMILSGKAATWDEANRKVGEKAFSRPCYLYAWQDVDLRTVSEVDWGDFKLQRAPEIDVEVIREDGRPAVGAVIRIDYTVQYAGRPWQGKLDDLGRLHVPLAGWDQKSQVGISLNPASDGSGAALSRSVSVAVGETVQLKLILPATPPGELGTPMHVKLKDPLDGRPIEGAEFAVGEEYGDLRGVAWSRVRSGNAYRWTSVEAEQTGGGYTLKGVRLEKQLESRRTQIEGGTYPADHPYLNQLYDGPIAHLAVFAPGRAVTAFPLSYRAIAAGGEFEFELEAGSEVIGRLTLGSVDGKPANPVNLAEFLAKPGDEKDLGRILENNQYTGVTMLNWGRLADPRPKGSSPRQQFEMRATIDADGRFRFQGLKPGDGWGLRVNVSGPAPVVMEDIRLEPGVRDLGAIVLRRPGRLVGSVKEVGGAPIELLHVGCRSSADLPRRDQFYTSLTGVSGEFDFGIEHLDRDWQIVRLTPPWGYVLEPDGDIVKMDIYYEAAKTLDRAGENRIETVISRGHDLKVTIPVTPAGIEAAAELSRQFARRFEDEPKRDRPKHQFAVCGAGLMALDAVPQGFVYHQRFSVKPPGLKLEGNELVMTIPNVPPGRMAIRLNGSHWRIDDYKPKTVPPGIYKTEEELADAEAEAKEENDKEREYQAAAIEAGWPKSTDVLGYGEFAMPDNDYELTVPISAGRIELSLDGCGEDSRKFYIQTCGILERIGAESSAFGHPLFQDLGMGRSSLNAKNYMHPMLGYYCSLDPPEEERDPGKVPTAVIVGVPEGRYRLRAYASAEAYYYDPTRFYFEKELEVKAGEGTVHQRIPYEAPAESRERR